MTKRKQIFDYIRRLARRGLRQHEVDHLNGLLDAQRKPDAPSAAERADIPSRTSAAGIALIHEFEACARKRADGLFEAYPDPGSRDGLPWTIGWGATRGGLHGFVNKDTVWTQVECDERFSEDLRIREHAVVRSLGDAIDNTNKAQFDALVSFHYNTGAIARATLTRKHVAGDHEGAACEFRRWVRNDGMVLAGLVRRRKAEERAYRRPA